MPLFLNNTHEKWFYLRSNINNQPSNDPRLGRMSIAQEINNRKYIREPKCCVADVKVFLARISCQKQAEHS